MRFKNVIKSIISFSIVIAIALGMIPATFAIKFNENEKYIPSKIIKEEINKREESSKTFLCEDGSYIAVTYSEPVHFKNGEMWKEIDNSLILDNDNKYKPRASGYTIELPDELSDSSNIVAKNDKYSLSFSVNPIKSESFFSSQAQRTSVKDLASSVIYSDSNYDENPSSDDPDIIAVEKYNKAVTTVKNQKDALVYKDVFPGVDFEYIVSSGALKENIVVNEPKQEYKYSFDVDFSGLTPKNNPDGSITLMDGDNIVFILSAPYMYDMNRMESTEVKMSLEQSNGRSVLTIAADCEWINSEERAYPIIIDPSVNIPTNYMNDVFVEDLLFANSPRSNNELRAGKNLTNLTRTYIKTELPSTIPYGSVITSATLTLYKENYFQAWNQSNINIVACDCSNVLNWSSSNITWNNQPFSNAANGYQNVSNCQITSVTATNSKSTYVFELKTAAQKWLNTGNNNGVMLASSNENSKTQVDFYSTRANDSTKHPYMAIYYNQSAVEPNYWAPSSEASNKDINVVCDPSWSIISSDYWLSYSNKTSSGFKAQVIENTSINNRTGVISIMSNGHTIGTVTVTQLGITPQVETTEDEIVLNYDDTETIYIPYMSNIEFGAITFSDWITVDKNTNTNQIEITVTQNNSNAPREGTVVLLSSVFSSVISVKQLDKVSSYFSKRDGNQLVDKTALEYNHPLATWCMNLSNYSYNPLTGLSNIYLAGFVNSSKTVTEEMNYYGFSSKTYNTGICQMFAHTISHRTITTANGQNRTLVFVVVRGTETIPEIISDMCSEFSPNGEYSFGRGSRIVLTSLLGENYNNELSGNYELCTCCGGSGCDYCGGYLNHYNIDNPIIVVTGHSLGAAVSNIVVHELNQISNGVSSIYGYTFGTPYINSTTGNIPTGDVNLYNILNNNDVVTFVPMSISVGSYVQGTWYRYGRDLRIVMPYFSNILSSLDPAYLGIGGHIMRIYENWMESLPNSIGEEAKNITYERMLTLTSLNNPIGILPRIASKVLKIFCPVDVTLYDGEGHIIAYEGRNNPTNNSDVPVEIASWSTDNGEKVFVLPYGYDEANVHIEAYDYGTMTYSVATIGLDEPLAGITYNSVNLYPGKEFSSEISSDFSPDNTQLFVVENGIIVDEVTETEPMLKNITSNYTEAIYPTAIEFTITTDISVTEINLYNRTSGETMHLVPGGIYVISVVNDGNQRVWTIGFYAQQGNNIYDLSLKSGDNWYDYENVIAVNIISPNN